MSREENEQARIPVQIMYMQRSFFDMAADFQAKYSYKKYFRKNRVHLIVLAAKRVTSQLWKIHL